MLVFLFLVFKSLKDILYIFIDINNILRKRFSLNVSNYLLSYAPLFRRYISVLSLCKTVLVVDNDD